MAFWTSSNRSEEAARSEAGLLTRLRAGDMGAFEALHREQAPRLFALACRMLGDEADAEDALQEVFLLAHRKLAGFKGESSIGTWLYRLMVNWCLDRLRSRGHRNDLRTDGLEAEELADLAAPPAGRFTVDRLDLERAIRQLADGCRTVFVLHDVEGFGHAEIAATLGISEGTSKSQLHKARYRLRRLLVGAPAGVGATGRRERRDNDLPRVS
ncbi:MAG: sigma-70 family RNA polymerase sigma factor [Vicinamibacteraceae bacterium]|nr:sigma-70 family RNA polymerase sigma factor [Vicinamibacteraceae bacterium]